MDRIAQIKKKYNITDVFRLLDYYDFGVADHTTYSEFCEIWRETMFSVGDRVTVIDGFYLGFVGTITSYNIKVAIPDDTLWHQVTAANGNKVNVSEKNLQKENNTMKLNLKGGVTVEGTPEEVMKIAKQLGVDLIAEGYYNSSTHGLIKISDMDTRHVTNATLKAYRVFVEGLSKLSLPDVVKAMQNGPSDKEFNNLFTELVKRSSK